MDIESIVTGFIRTAVPYLVGALVSWLTVRGITLDEQAVTGFTAFLTAVFGQLYYLIARLLEQKDSKWGILLGVRKQPVYTESK